MFTIKQLVITLQFFLGLTVLCFIIFFLTFQQGLEWESVWGYRSLFIKGWLITVALSFVSLFLSLVFGLIAAWMKRTPFFVISSLAKVYIEIIRGTPLLVQILFFYYVVAHQIGLENRYVAGVVALSLFHGAYIAEMIRGGFESISATQLESARAIGLTPFQSYWYVIFPQAVRQLIPSLAGQFASIIKDSSLLSIIGINELTNSAQQINSATYSTLEVFFPLGIAYFVLTFPISLLSKKLEKIFKYET